MFNLQARELVDFLALKKLTPNQLLFCYLIYTQQMDLFFKYVHEVKAFSLEDVRDLEDRGYVINQDYHSGTVYNDMYVVTEKLLDGLDLIDTTQAEEFWLTYPNFLLIQNSRISAKSTDKGEFLLTYSRTHIKSRKLHDRVMKALNYAKDNNLVTMGIVKWVASAQWEVVEELMGKDLSNYGNSEF